MDLLTIDELMAATETRVTLPALSALLGHERAVRVRRIGRAEYLAHLPAPPPGAHEWPREEWAQREQAWLATLDEATRRSRQAALDDVPAQLVAAACLEPALTVEQARRLGDDATVVAAEVLRFSGLLGASEPAAEAGPEAPEPAAVAA